MEAIKMQKLTKTATILDRIFKILQIIFTTLAIVAAVFVGIILLGWLLGWNPDTIATGYETLDFGFLELQIADAFAPDKWIILLEAGVVLALCGVCCLLGRYEVKCIRAILDPMKQGRPFSREVSVNLKKMAILGIFTGIAINCVDLAEQIMLAVAYDLPGLLISEKITHIGINYTFDLTFLIYSAVLLLLSYVFSYGTQLQELSDETL